MSEPFINHELLARVRKARLEMPDYDKPWEILEERHLSKLGDQCEAYEEADFAAIVLVALRKYPAIVMKIILDELEGKNP